MAIIVDFDQWVVDVHAVYKHLFANKETAKEFIDFFSEKNEEKAVTELKKSLRRIKTEPDFYAGSKNRDRRFKSVSSQRGIVIERFVKRILI